ncbi:MAG TPA: sorbosone dehydrogenase family protein, partial [Hydrogenophaga sp.]|nr:sorbosone dehydrogenase family protein [Hydrogenophaga sp.]
MTTRPSRWHLQLPLIVLTAGLVGACGESAQLKVETGYGADPPLPEPVRTVIPTVKVAPAQPWEEGQRPTAQEGTTVRQFAGNLDHPRWMHVLPNGDVLVAETNAPARPLRDELLGIKGKVMGMVMKRAGAATPSANRLTLLRDADGDGVAELKTVFLENLNSPFGMALVGNELFIANTDALVKVPYQTGDTQASGPVTQVAELPGGPLNHHWTKGLLASADGNRLYVSVGSNSNVAEHGMQHEEGRAAIWEFDRASGKGRLFASGLRNPVGMAWQGDTLWTSVNERDELGSDLVPDYMTSVRDGGFYGWPYSYYGQTVDTRPEPPRPDLVATAIRPDYALGGPFAESGMFVGQHGSWNRRPPSGYKVIYVPFDGAQPSGSPIDVLTGFLDADGNARGRPVG